MLKRKLELVSGLILTLALLLSACGGGSTTSGTSSNSQGSDTASKTETAKPIELKLVSFLALDHDFTKDIIPMWKEKVETAFNGAVTVKLVGGPESFAPADQFDVVRNGIADIGFNVSSFYMNQMPDTNAFFLSPYTPWEERENGFYNYMTNRYQKFGLVYLGKWQANVPFYLWSNKEISSLDDLKGLKLRSNPTFHELMKGLEINPVDVSPADVYTALERNMVEGFGFPILGPRSTGWTEVTKYVIDEGFYHATNATVLMNADTFNKLTPEQQKTMMKVQEEFEHIMYDYFKEASVQERKNLEETGIKFIQLSEEERKKFQDIVINGKWAAIEKGVPEQVDELKKLLKYNQ